MATVKRPLSAIKTIGDPIAKLATNKSTVSPEQLEKFVNFLPEGQRSPMDFANEMSRRGYSGAGDMIRGAKDTQAAFAKDNRDNPNAAAQNYVNDRKYSQLWHQNLIQDVLAHAKRLGMKDKNTMLANKDVLLQNTQLGPDNFKTIMNQYAGNGESKADNFWRVTGDLYDSLQKKEKKPPAPISKLTGQGLQSIVSK